MLRRAILILVACLSLALAAAVVWWSHAQAQRPAQQIPQAQPGHLPTTKSAIDFEGIPAFGTDEPLLPLPTSKSAPPLPLAPRQPEAEEPPLPTSKSGRPLPRP